MINRFTAVIFTSMLLAPSAQAVPLDATWNGGIGDWDDGSFWAFSAATGASFPNNGVDTFDVFIDGGNVTNSIVTLNTSATIDSLTIGSGDELVIDINRLLSVNNAIVNDGTISLNDNSASFVTDLRVNDTVTYSGSGVFSNTDITTNRLVGIGANATLVNQSSLVLDAGFMEINALTVDNQGTIQANAGATLLISANSLIEGGLITTTGDGTVRVANGADIKDVTIGSITVPSSFTLNTSGDLTVSGALKLQDTNAGFFTTLFLIDTVNFLGGGGVIETTDTLDNRIAGSAGAVFNINGDLTITGEAGNPGGLRIDVDTINNNATLLSDNATVRLESSNINNTNGVIEAQNGSTIELASTLNITGGTLRSDNSSLFSKSSGNVTLTDTILDTNSRLEVQSNQTLDLASSFTNNGTLHLDDSSAGFFTTVRIVGPVTYTGTGEITATDSFENRIIGLDASAVLTNTTNLDLNAGSMFIGPLNLINQGAVRANNGASLRLLDVVFDNTAGTIEANDNSTVEFNSGTEVTGGTLVGNAGSKFDVNGGGASVFTDVTLGSGANLNITSNQALTLKNSFTNNGVLHFDDQSAGFNTRLNIDGPVTYSGTGSVTATNSFENQLIGLVRDTAELTNLDVFSLDTGSLVVLGLDVNNQGTIQSDNGATLRLQSTVIDNLGGVIAAHNGAKTEINFSVEIQNGELTTTNNGLIELINDATLDNIQLTTGSELALGSNATDLRVKTALENNGNILLNDQTAGFLTQILIDGTVDYSGTGTLSASDSFENRLSGVGVGAVLNNNTNLLLDSGQLRLASLMINNNGIITAADGATIHLQSGTHIKGGTLTTSGGGILRSDTSGTGLILEDVTVGAGGELTIGNNLGAELRGTFGLDGHVSQLDADGSFNTRINLFGDVVFIGGNGAFTPSQNSANEIFGGAGSTFTIQNDLRVNGGALTFRNIQATSSANILADNADLLFTGTDLLQTNGSIDASNNSTVRLASGVLIDGGELTTDATSLLETAGGAPILRDTRLTVGSRIRINNNNQLNLENTFTNEGTVSLEDADGSFNTTIIAGNDVTLFGNGVFLNSANNANRFSGPGSVTVADQLVLAGGNMFFNAPSLNNLGLVAADSGAFLDFNGNVDIVNLPGTTLTGGTWRSLGNGSILELTNKTITHNSAEIILAEAGSIFRGVQNIEETLTNNNADGILRVLANRDYTTVLDFINDGTVEIGGGTFDSATLANNAGAEIFGFGAITPVVASSGLVRATGGTLIANAGIDGQSGTIQIDADGALVIGANSDGDFLIHNGDAGDSLNLQTFDIIVDQDYTNGNFGIGNDFNARANVIGSGQILANGDVAQSLTGEVSDGTTANPTIAFGNVHVGDVNTRTYQINNTGTVGPALRGAIQTAANGGNVTDERLGGSGASASNFGPIAPGANSGDLVVEFNATSAGELLGQIIHLENNFDNVAGQDISVGGAAYRFANPDITPDPISLVNVHVGEVSEQALNVLNDVPDDGFSEGLNASFGANSGDALNNGGSISLLGPSASDNASLVAGIDTTTAGAKSGTVTIDLVSDGTGSSELGQTILPQQIINISGNVYRFADADVTPDPIVLANVHVGESSQQNLSVSNQAANDGFSESLNAVFAANTGDAINNGANINLLAAGATNSTSLIAGIDTSSAGAKSGTVTIDLTSDGSGTSELGQTELPSQTINVSGNVYRLAEALITPQPVTLANVHINDTSEQTLTVTNQSNTDGFSESLDAALGGTTGDATSNGGAFNALDAGSSNNTSLIVGIDTTSVGAKSGSVAVSLTSNGDGISGLGLTALTSQNINVSGNVFGFAAAAIDESTLDFVMRRGESSVGQTFNISNIAAADGFHEGLDSNLANLADGYGIVGGDASNLAAGTSTSATVSLLGTTSGVFNGEARFNLDSNGTLSGLADTPLADQTVSLTGRVYETAVADVQTNNIDFGIVHVGDVVGNQNIVVANAADGALNDNLAGEIATTPIGFNGSGNLGAGLAAGNTDSTSLSVALDTSAAGVFSGDASLSFASTNSELNDLALAEESVSLFAQVNNFVNPDIDKLNGDGSFSMLSPTLIELDFGTLVIGSGAVQAELGISNNVMGPADTLRGEFNLGTTVAGFSGFNAFTDINAGESQNGLLISFDPIALGNLNDIVVIQLFGFNASGFEQALAPIQLSVTANVAPVPLPAPVWMLLSAIVVLARARRKT